MSYYLTTQTSGANKDDEHYPICGHLVGSIRVIHPLPSYNTVTHTLTYPSLYICICIKCFIIHVSRQDLYTVITTGGFMFTVFCYFIVKNQEGMLYHPRTNNIASPEENPKGYQSPAERGLEFKEVYITTQDKKRLHCWFIHRGNEVATKTAQTILFFHANAGNMGFRMDNLVEMSQTFGLNIFIVSYRGYGKSEGSPSEEGLIMDAEAALEHLKASTEIDTSKIIVFGRSLGGAVAIALASKYSEVISGLIVENTFTSISDMVDQMFFFLKPFKKYVLRLHYKSIERIEQVTCPVLFLSGLKDEVVPWHHMRSLYEKCNNAEFKHNKSK